MIINTRNESNLKVISNRLTKTVDYTDVLEFTIPLSDEILLDDIIQVKSDVINQKYRVHKVDVKNGIQNVYCKHIFFDTEKIVIPSIQKTEAVTLEYVTSHINLHLRNNGYPFKIDSTIRRIADVEIDDTSLYNIIFGDKGILNQYNCKVLWNDYSIKFVDTIPARNTEILFHEKKNAVDLQKSIDSKDVVTKLYVKGKHKKVDTPESREEEARARREKFDARNNSIKNSQLEKAQEIYNRRKQALTASISNQRDTHNRILARQAEAEREWSNSSTRPRRTREEIHREKLERQNISNNNRVERITNSQISRNNSIENDNNKRLERIRNSELKRIQKFEESEQNRELRRQAKENGEQYFRVVVTSPIAEQYPRVYEASITVEDPNIVDTDSLARYCQENFFTENDTRDIPIDTFTFKPTQDNYDINLHDIARVNYSAMEISKNLPCCKIEYDAYNNKYISIEFGELKYNARKGFLTQAIKNSESKANAKISSMEGEFGVLWRLMEEKVREELEAADLTFDDRFEEKTKDIEEAIHEAELKAIETQGEIAKHIEDEKQGILETVRETTADFNRRLEEEKRITESLVNGLSNVIADEAESLRRDSSILMAEAKREASRAVDGLRVSTENTLNSIKGSVSNLDRKFDSNGELISLKHYKSQVEQKDREITTKLTALEQYKSQDGTRQTTLLSLAERKTNELLSREISRLSDTYVAKNTLTETIRGSERKIIEGIKGFGRNYFLNTKNFSGEWYHGSNWSNETLDNNFAVKSRTGAWAGISQSIQSDTEEWWTYSVDVMGEGTNGVMIYALHGANSANVNVNQQYISITNSWQRFSFTFKVISAGIIRPRVEKTNNTGKVYIKKIKLEKGTLATPWSPAPEDGETFFTDRLATYRQEVDRSFTELRGIATDGKSLATRIEADLRGVTSQVSTLDGKLNAYKTEREQTDRSIRDSISTINRKFDASGELISLKTYKSQVEQKDREIRSKVTTLENGTLKKSEVIVTDSSVELGSGKIIDGRKLGSILSVSPEGIQAITDKMTITAYNENLVLLDYRGKKHRFTSDGKVSVDIPPSSDTYEFFIKAKVILGGYNNRFKFVPKIKYEDNTIENATVANNNYHTAAIDFSFTYKFTPNKNKKVKCVYFWIDRYGNTELENLEIYQKKSASLIVDGSITADQIKALAIQAGHIDAGAVTSEKIAALAVEAKHIKVDNALITKLVAEEALITKLMAKQAFINKLNAITINASQIIGGLISGDMIRGGVIRGTTIEGVTIQGNSKIKIGTYGFLQPITHGLQINAPASQGASYGVGVQIAGSTSGGKPKGIFIYNDNNFNTGASLKENIDDVLLTVNGRMSMCNSHNGQLMRGQPIISNFSYANPVSNNYRISFIGWDARHGQLYVDDGTGSNGTWWFSPESSASDIKLKRNIIKTEHKGLEIIEKLNFYEFDWKPDKFGFQKPHTKIGQIAQELEIIDSSLVYKKGDTLAIDDFRMLNIALKAIQELNTEIKILKEKIA